MSRRVKIGDGAQAPLFSDTSRLSLADLLPGLCTSCQIEGVGEQRHSLSLEGRERSQAGADKGQGAAGREGYVSASRRPCLPRLGVDGDVSASSVVIVMSWGVSALDSTCLCV